MIPTEERGSRSMLWSELESGTGCIRMQVQVSSNEEPGDSTFVVQFEVVVQVEADI